MSFSDDLKAKLLEQARRELFDAAKETAAITAKLGDRVATLFQNPSTPPGDQVAGMANNVGDFAEAQAELETQLGAALETYTEIIRLGADLARGKLPA